MSTRSLAPLSSPSSNAARRHDRAFTLFKSTCSRGYDNIKSASETIFVGY